MNTLITAVVLAGAASLTLADNVNPGVIFGSGNANGSFTTATEGNIEIGLRGKLRYNSMGVPEATYNYDGVDTYTFDPDVSANPANRSIWNFDWSINTDVNDPTNSGDNISEFIYALTVSKVAANGMDLIQLFTFDPINVDYADHSIGDNDTLPNSGVEATTDAEYATLIGNNNVLQQSWNLGFFNSNPTAKGTYVISLEVFSADFAFIPADPIVSDTIYINVVPVPTAVFAGLGMLGALAGVRVVRRR